MRSGNNTMTKCLTQDWHPKDIHLFASSHKSKAPFEIIEMFYGAQTLWPDHCIVGEVKGPHSIPIWKQVMPI